MSETSVSASRHTHCLLKRRYKQIHFNCNFHITGNEMGNFLDAVKTNMWKETVLAFLKAPSQHPCEEPEASHR
jgi:hypothetical protein